MTRVFFLITLILSLVSPFCSSQAEEQYVLKLESAKALFLQWVNEARANPWAEAERLSLDVTVLREQVGQAIAGQWDEGLPPLQWNEQLAFAATCHVHDMLARLYYSHINPDGVGTYERIRAAGYDPVFWSESLGSVAFMNVIPAQEATRIIYERLLMDALCRGTEGAPLLDPLLRDIGLCIDGGPFLVEDSWYNAYILVCDLGCAKEDVPYGQGVLFGRLFADVDGNGLYSHGEERAGELVFFFPFDFSMSVFTYTFSDGSFFFPSAGDNGYLVPVFFGDAESLSWLVDYNSTRCVIVKPVVLPAELKSISP